MGLAQAVMLWNGCREWFCQAEPLSLLFLKLSLGPFPGRLKLVPVAPA